MTKADLSNDEAWALARIYSGDGWRTVSGDTKLVSELQRWLIQALATSVMRLTAELESRCHGCGYTKAECDLAKQGHRVCCPGCKHRPAVDKVAS